MSEIVLAGQSPFEQIRHTDEHGDEWWSARELAELLTYKWQNFENVIQKAKAACEKSGNDIESHFTASSKVTTGGKHGMQTLSDIRLTRYACYLVAQNADPTQKKIVAQAQTYFAVKTRGMELIEDDLSDLITELGDDPLAEAMRRILFRQELTEAHKRLFDQAREAGIITNEQWAWFMNQGYKGLYAGRTRMDIQALKGLKRSQEISDYMSALETFANVLRAMVAKQRLRDRNISTIAAAGRTHYQAGHDVRRSSSLLAFRQKNCRHPPRAISRSSKMRPSASAARKNSNRDCGANCHQKKRDAFNETSI